MATQQKKVQQEDDRWKRLTKIRGENRGKVTKLINEASDFIQRYLEGTTEPEIKTKLSVIAKSLNEKKTYLGQLVNEMLQKCSIEEIDVEVHVLMRLFQKLTIIVKFQRFPSLTSQGTVSPELRPTSRIYTPP